MSCIGTAGHVDHGKSTLVKALTGIDPDRLAEEKERGMTIDLGFAWLTLPSGREVSIVDVPGHESFIKNMLAGVGGIDAALLVIAADESVMPQTREHLAILDLLRVSRGVVALTKADLVDEEWLELVREEIVEVLKPTTLADAAIVPVSAYTGQGLPQLLAQLDTILSESDERQNIARPRLPIDRVFSMTGFGTVVTGTLLDGNFKLGQEVEILPEGIRTRIRSLQTHRQQVEVAQPGSRVAINVANVARSDLSRGNVVALPGQLRTTLLFDARIHLLADTERPLTHNMQIDLYTGSQEVSARVRLLDTEELQAGQSGWAQLRLSRPVVVARRDRFILRIPSPSMTIGGGEVIDVLSHYHKRFQAPIIEHLERLSHGSPEELVLAALNRRHILQGGSVATRQTVATTKVATLHAKAGQGFLGYEMAEIVKLCNLSEDVTQQALETLLLEGRVQKVSSKEGSSSVTGSAALWFAQPVWENLIDEAMRLVREYHQQYPLRGGLSKEEWRARLKLPPKLAAEVFTILQAGGQLEVVPIPTGEAMGVRTGATTGLIRVIGFTPRFTAVQQHQVDNLLQRFHEHPFTPPTRTEAEAIADVEVVTSLIEQGQLLKLGDGILFLRETYTEALTQLVRYIRKHGKMTAAEARDVIGTSRKYILPLLEHMDTLHITRRVGDERFLGVSAEKIIQGE